MAAETKLICPQQLLMAVDTKISCPQPLMIAANKKILIRNIFVYFLGGKVFV